jgi:hypothetical protein
MDSELTKEILLGLAAIARHHQTQIGLLSEALSAIRVSLDPAADAKIGTQLRDNLVAALQAGKSADPAIQRLNEIIEQIQKL